MNPIINNKDQTSNEKNIIYKKKNWSTETAEVSINKKNKNIVIALKNFQKETTIKLTLMHTALDYYVINQIRALAQA